MTVDKLANFIDDTIKHFASPRGVYREKYIEVMSRNQREFMNFSHVANGKEKYNVAALAERMGNFLLENPTHLDALKEIFTQDKANQSLENFLRELDGGIIFTLSEQIGIKNIVDEVRKEISKDNDAWLWDKETATEEVRKLIVDYKIIAATNALGIECKSIGACVREWNNRTQFIRVPCKIISEYYPALKKFFELLCLMIRREELPHDKREIFLAELQKNSAQIREVLKSEKEVLTKKYSSTFADLREEDIDKIISLLPTNSFIDEKSDFVRYLTTLADRIKKNQLNYKLKERWKSITKSESPRDWSKKNRTPILALVPAAELNNARKNKIGIEILTEGE